jgi:hypothetical protein
MSYDGCMKESAGRSRVLFPMPAAGGGKIDEAVGR